MLSNKKVTILWLVERFNKTGSVNYEKKKHPCRVLTEEKKIDDGLTFCDFYLWGKLRNKVHATNPHMLDELKDSIQWEIKHIHAEELMHVNAEFLYRCQICIEENGQHFHAYCEEDKYEIQFNPVYLYFN